MELIPVSLNGVYAEVHPTALAQHKALGWRECEKQVDESKKATVAELREALTAKGIDIPDGAKKAELQALLDAVVSADYAARWPELVPPTLAECEAFCSAVTVVEKNE